MKWVAYTLASVALMVSLPANAWVDCAALRTQFQCGATARYPLHLSFDDGPALQTTAVLDVLKREKIPATFFFNWRKTGL